MKNKRFWEDFRKRETLRRQLEMQEMQRAHMHEKVVHYDPQPFYKMTPLEASAFAVRQAERAAESLRLTEDEKSLYAQEIYASIQYFNSRDPKHAAYMRYLAEKKCMQETESKTDKKGSKAVEIIIK